MSALVVAGIGSRHLVDDAIGLRLVESLDQLEPGVRPELWEDADALTLTYRLLELSAPVLLVDCADMELAGGEWRCFRVSSAGEGDGRLLLHSPALSSHGPGLAWGVEIALALGLAWPVHVFAVQPFQVELRPGAGDELSPAMCSRLPALLTALRQRIRALSVTSVEEV